MKRIVCFIGIVMLLMCGAFYTSDSADTEAESSASESGKAPEIREFIFVPASDNGEVKDREHGIVPEEQAKPLTVSSFSEAIEQMREPLKSQETNESIGHLIDIGVKPDIPKKYEPAALDEDSGSPTISLFINGEEWHIPLPPAEGGTGAGPGATFTDKSLFTSQCPLLSIEDYENPTPPLNYYCSVDKPFSPATSVPGCISPGNVSITMTTDGDDGGDEILMLDEGFLPYYGIYSQIAVVNTYVNNTIFELSSPVNAFGLDVYMFEDGPNGSRVTAEIFNGYTSLGTYTFTIGPYWGFWGIVTPPSVTFDRIVFEEYAMFTDNILYGNCTLGSCPTGYSPANAGPDNYQVRCDGGPWSIDLDGSCSQCPDIPGASIGALDAYWTTDALVYDGPPPTSHCFDLENTSSTTVEIQGFDLMLADDDVPDTTILVYYKSGTSIGFESDPSSWTLMGIETVSCEGRYDRSEVNIGGLQLSPGETYGIKIFSTGWGTLVYQWNRYDPNLPATYSDSYLQLTTGRFSIGSQWAPVWDYGENIVTVKYGEPGTPGAYPLSYQWETDCPDAYFTDPTSAHTTLLITAGSDCKTECRVELITECFVPPTPPPVPPELCILKNQSFEACGSSNYCLDVYDWEEIEVNPFNVSSFNEDSYLAQCGGRIDDMDGDGKLLIYCSTSTTDWMEAYQDFDITAGGPSTLKGWARFATNEDDNLSHNDEAQVYITGPGGPWVPWSKDVMDVGLLGCTSWETWTWIAPGPGAYRISYRIRSQGSSLDDSSYAWFDMVNCFSADFHTIEEITTAEMGVCSYEFFEDCPVGLKTGTEPCLHDQTGTELMDLMGGSDSTPYPLRVEHGADGHALCRYTSSTDPYIQDEGGNIYGTAAGGGFVIEFPTGIEHDQISFEVVSEGNVNLEIELFSGTTSLAKTQVIVNTLDIQWFLQCSAMFDRVEFTTPINTAGWCLDNICFADAPPPLPAGYFRDYANVVVGDSEPPYLYGVPPDTTFECDEIIPVAPAVTATDNCTGVGPVSMDEVRIDGECDSEYKLKRTWSVTDACDNTTTATQTISIVDTTPPAIFGVPSDITISCEDPVPSVSADVIATDNCNICITKGILDIITYSNGFNSMTEPKYRQTFEGYTTASLSDALAAVHLSEVTMIGAPWTIGQTLPFRYYNEFGDWSGLFCEPGSPYSSPIIANRFNSVRGIPRYDGTTYRGYAFKLNPGELATEIGFKITNDNVLYANIEIYRDGVFFGYGHKYFFYYNEPAFRCTAPFDEFRIMNYSTSAAYDEAGIDEIYVGGIIPDTGFPGVYSEQHVNVIGDDCYTLERTWTATDCCGNTATETCNITIEDTVAPKILDVPPDETIECDSIIPDPPLTLPASDNCDPDVTVTFSQNPAPCTTDELQTLATASSSPYSGSGAVGPQVANDGVVCDGDPYTPYHYIYSYGSWIGWYELTWPEAMDICRINVDTKQVKGDVCAPSTTNSVLSNATVQYWDGTAYQTIGSVSGMEDDWAMDFGECITTTKLRLYDISCNPAYGGNISFTYLFELQVFKCGEVTGPDPCDFDITRTWTAVDNCGNTDDGVQVLRVVDTTPPVITEDYGIKYCIWPPNHTYHCFTLDDFAPVLADNCNDDISFHFAGCASDQPDDDIGGEDGHTVDDCMVSPDGTQFCVRAERHEGYPGGRNYEITVIATDGCSNDSDPAVIGYIHVPYDMDSDPSDCIFVPK